MGYEETGVSGDIHIVPWLTYTYAPKNTISAAPLYNLDCTGKIIQHSSKYNPVWKYELISIDYSHKINETNCTRKETW